MPGIPHSELQMISLIYVSTAVYSVSKQELIASLRYMRARNKKLDITGLLLYQDRNIIQVLEGEEAAVHQLFESICKDPRHRGVIRLTECHIDKRQFTGWSIGFKECSDPTLHDLPGYSQFMDQPLESEAYRANPARAYRLIDLFRRNMR